VSSFHRSFLQEDGRDGSRAWLAAFGKHPGWDDHIDDLGVETESLALAKQLIYLQGISSQIDSGAWEKLEPGSRLDGFDHLFLWQRGRNCLLGCIVSSVDGKGRARYPMIVCAHVVDVALGRVLTELCPLVENAMSAARAAATADAVRQILTEARETLRRSLAAPPLGPAGPMPAPIPILSPILGGAALHRILYQIKNHFAPWAAGRGSDDPHEQNVLLRVPQAVAGAAEGLGLWANFVGSQLSETAPRLLIWSRAGTWLDAIAGQPAPADFFGLRANTRALPCASDVPYEMDAAFRTEAEALIAGAADGGEPHRSIFGLTDNAPPVRKLAQRAASASQAAGEKLQHRLEDIRANLRQPKRGWLLWAGVALVAVLVVVVAAKLLRRPSPTPQAIARPAATAQSTANTEIRAPWRALCAAYYEWLGGLRTALNDAARRSRWTADEQLRTGVLGPLGAVGAPRTELDPRVLSASKTPLPELGNEPPPAIATGEGAERVLAAAAAVVAVEKALTSWPTLARARADREKLLAHGWTNAVSSINLPETLPLNATLAAAIDATLGEAQPLAQARESADAWAVDLRQLRDAGDPALRSAAEAMVKDASGATSLKALEEKMAQFRGELAPVVALLAAEWTPGRIDRVRFLKERGERWAEGLGPVALLKQWTASVSDYAEIGDAASALPTTEWQKGLADVQRLRGELATVASGPEADKFGGRQRELEQAWEALRGQRLVRKESFRLGEAARTVLVDLARLSSDLSGEVARRVDPAGWMQQLRTINFAESPVIQAEWHRQREDWLQASNTQALKADLRQFVAARARADRVERFLRQLAVSAALPEGFPADEVLDDALARDLKVRLHSAREHALTKLVEMAAWTAEGPAESEEEFWRKPTVRPVISDYLQVYDRLKGFGTDITRIEVFLQDGEAWQGLPKGMFDKWRGDWATPDTFAGLPRISAMIQRATTLDGLCALKDRALLVAAVQRQSLAEAITAWRRLGELPNWLHDSADFTTEEQLVAVLKQKVDAELKNPNHRSSLHGELAKRLRDRWQAALQRANAEADFIRLFTALTWFGVSESELTPAHQFNLLLHQLRAGRWTSLSKADARAARDDAILALSRATGTEPHRIQTLTEQLRAVDFETGSVDLATVGPAKVDWKLESAADPDRPVYTWTIGARTHRLEFVRLPVAGLNVYFCATEIPVQLFLDWVEYRTLGKQVIAAQQLMLDDFGSGRPARGPRSVIARKDGASWRLSRATSGWRDASTERISPAENEPRPSELSPINYVSFAAAQLFAGDLNCRLPTSEEWQSAAQVERTAGAARTRPNLRDARWGRQMEFQNGLVDKVWPDSDVFVPAALVAKVPTGSQAKIAGADDDGVLWFSEVRHSATPPPWHVIGNVAELVIGPGGKPGVIGGSALSAPEMIPEQFWEIDRGNERRGFADVGFRPAFTVGELSGAARVQSILANTAFQPVTK